MALLFKIVPVVVERFLLLSENGKGLSNLVADGSSGGRGGEAIDNVLKLLGLFLIESGTGGLFFKAVHFALQMCPRALKLLAFAFIFGFELVGLGASRFNCLTLLL
ncbi:hypothetical protein D7Y13_43745 [Corallococcus praedator]|uniref:Uncharacterized protein n=1 Tax=Corallococcus praedator TaxID=2316724 RepID=A0ABX9Q226_9BACT|nr:hypothetical protein D7Y13_43745 [Corallococcus praedator]